MFDNGYDFKRDFTTFLKDFNIKPVLTSVKNPQANATVEQVHQLLLNMLVTKDLDNKVFDYIDPWGENLEYIEWEIRDYYHSTIMHKLGHNIFGWDMLFNLASVVDWRVATAANQIQVDIDSVIEMPSESRMTTL